MPFHFERDDARLRIVLVATGTIVVEDWADAAAHILLDQVWHYATLYDFTSAEAALPSAADMATIAPSLRELVEQEGGRGAVAFAVPRDEDYARIHEWIATAGRRVLRLVDAFRTREEAERWLDAIGIVPPRRPL